MAGKPIRLGKAASELNVGLPTLVDFLEKKGVKIDSHPNTRLEPEQYDLLCQEFATDHDLKEQSKGANSRREKRESIALNEKSDEQKIIGGKPIRLGKAASELNVGLPTLVDFLAKKGVIIDSNPNSRLEPEQYEILLDEFGDNFVNDDISEPEEPEIHTIPGFILKTNELKKKKINDKLSIGFSNFKRFEKFPMIELKAINFFVGPNNAGKSTAVKAYRIVSEYLKSKGEYFDLFGSWDDHANKFSNHDKIYFIHTLGDYELNVTLFNNLVGVGQSEVTNFKVSRLSLKNTNNNFKIDVYYMEEMLIFQIPRIEEVKTQNPTFELDKELTKLNYEIEKLGNVRNSEYLKLVDKRNKIVDGLNSIESNENEIVSKEKLIQVYLNKSAGIIEEYTLENLLELIQRNIGFEIQRIQKEISDLNNNENGLDSGLDNEEIDISKIEELEMKIQQLNQILEDKRLKNFYKDFSDRVNAEEIIYLGANLTKQSSLFLIQHTDNQLSQAIHKYAELREIKTEFNGNDSDFVFLKYWMREFEILSKENNRIDSILDFEIIPKNGIAYEFNLLLKDKNKNSSLANMGMGSIQVMTLLLRLATLIRKSKTENKLYLVVVEEPELNLHPNFQAKLCDLFFEVNKEYPNIRFVIETHSEYMIRNSQWIGIDNNLFSGDSLNPFNLIYFHLTNGPYVINYTVEGRFDRDFGEGFYDQAGKTELMIYKKLRK